jgi:hypothetical protein
MKQQLLKTERNIIKRIFRPTKEKDGTWRIKAYNEFNNFIKKKNIINYIIAQRLNWFGSVYRMTRDRMAKNCVNGNR